MTISTKARIARALIGLLDQDDDGDFDTDDVIKLLDCDGDGSVSMMERFRAATWILGAFVLILIPCSMLLGWELYETKKVVRSLVAKVALTRQRSIHDARVKECTKVIGLVNKWTHRFGLTQPTGLGSGAIVSADGLVLTAAHLFIDFGKVEANDEFVIPLTDLRILVGIVNEQGRPEWEYFADHKDFATTDGLLQARHKSGMAIDLAVFRIAGTCDKNGANCVACTKPLQLPHLDIGHDAAVEEGDYLHFWGFPIKDSEKIIEGGRSTLVHVRKYAECVVSAVTDGCIYAPVKDTCGSGASGGPLVNATGQVVGVMSFDYGECVVQVQDAHVQGHFGDMLVDRQNRIQVKTRGESHFRHIAVAQPGHGLPDRPLGGGGSGGRGSSDSRSDGRLPQKTKKRPKSPAPNARGGNQKK